MPVAEYHGYVFILQRVLHAGLFATLFFIHVNTKLQAMSRRRPDL